MGERWCCCGGGRRRQEWAADMTRPAGASRRVWIQGRHSGLRVVAVAIGVCGSRSSRRGQSSGALGEEREGKLQEPARLLRLKRVTVGEADGDVEQERAPARRVQRSCSHGAGRCGRGERACAAPEAVGKCGRGGNQWLAAGARATRAQS
jgi:hypothetical protein